MTGLDMEELFSDEAQASRVKWCVWKNTDCGKRYFKNNPGGGFVTATPEYASCFFSYAEAAELAFRSGCTDQYVESLQLPRYHIRAPWGRFVVYEGSGRWPFRLPVWIERPNGLWGSWDPVARDCLWTINISQACAGNPIDPRLISFGRYDDWKVYRWKKRISNNPVSSTYITAGYYAPEANTDDA